MVRTRSRAPGEGSSTVSVDDELRQLRSVHDALMAEFAERLGPEVVSARFQAIVAAFSGAPIRTFVPVLAQRRARLDLGLTP